MKVSNLVPCLSVSFVMIICADLVLGESSSSGTFRSTRRFPRGLRTGRTQSTRSRASISRRLAQLRPPVVKTKSGPVRGLKVELNAGLNPVIKYLGIPYAKPPIGNLRWRETMEPSQWKGVYNATKMGAICPQPTDANLPRVFLPYWHKASLIRRQQMSEDCLYLNIYIPAAFYIDSPGHPNFYDKRLPVMVYFHGHSFSDGSGNLFDGSVLASRGNVIVVTFNYRLGVLGFLSTMERSAPGNYGLWDQIAVLRWISKNIENFGGNKELVTAFGSGSGAASIGILMLSHQTEGFFRRAILQSGSAVSPWAVVKQPKKHAKKLALSPSIDCYNDSFERMVACLRGKSWRELIAANVQPDLYNLAFGPVVDGSDKILSDSPDVLMSNDELISYDVMIGVVQGEGFGYVQDRLKTTLRSSSVQNGNRSTASQTVYKRGAFQVDVKRFVDAFYGDGNAVIEDIVQFVYTNWNDKENSLELKRSLMDMYTDRQWVEAAVRSAETQDHVKQPVFFYTFYHHPGSRNDQSWVQCAHGEEVPFVFGAPLLGNNHSYPYNFTQNDKMISLAVMTYWTNFARNGDPMVGVEQKTQFITGVKNPFEGVRWTRYYKNDDRRYLEISTEPSVKVHYRAQKVALWRCFIPLQAGESCNDGSSTLSYPEIPYVTPFFPQLTLSTSAWTPTNESLNMMLTRLMPKSPTAREGSGLSLQLSITLAVGFVLLFVNIIAFAVVSYQKERDKYKIKKLKGELQAYRHNDLSEGSAKPLASARTTVESCLDGEPDPNTTEAFVPNGSNGIGFTKEKLKRAQLPLTHTTENHTFHAPNDTLTSSSPPTPIGGTMQSSRSMAPISATSSRAQMSTCSRVKLLSPRMGGDGAFSEPPSASSVADVAFLSPATGKSGEESNSWPYGTDTTFSNQHGNYVTLDNRETLPYASKSLILTTGSISSGASNSARVDSSGRKLFGNGLRCRSALGNPYQFGERHAAQAYTSGTLQPARHAYDLASGQMDGFNTNDGHFHTLGCRNACSLQNLRPVGCKCEGRQIVDGSRRTGPVSTIATPQNNQKCPVLPVSSTGANRSATTKL